MRTKNVPNPSFLGLALKSWEKIKNKKESKNGYYKMLETIIINTCLQAKISNTCHTYNAIFPINLLQLFNNFLSTIRTAIIHNDYLKVHIPKMLEDEVD